MQPHTRPGWVRRPQAFSLVTETKQTQTAPSAAAATAPCCMLGSKCGTQLVNRSIACGPARGAGSVL
eukprot:363403-Chlamydomonas_euryale.AAC.29